MLLLLNTNYVQNYIAHKITASLSKKLGTQVSIKHVSISPFNKINIEGVLIKDQKSDTLVFANLCKIRITDWFFLQKEATLSYVGVEDAVVKINRTTPIWNYEFITNYFKSNDTTTNNNGTHYDIKKIDFKSVRFEQKDEWTGNYMKAAAVSIVADCKKLNLATGFIKIGAVSIDQPIFVMQVIPKRGPTNTPAATIEQSVKASLLNINADEITINKGALVIDNDFEKPYKHFDGTHLNFFNINATIKNAFFSEKEIKASIALNAKERSGLVVKKLNTNFTFNDRIMEFAKLDLQTNRSHVGNYYAMNFTNFEKDFSHYISNVIMIADLKESSVSTDDIAFFAPAMSIFKTKAVVSGKYKGTVEDFTVANLQLKTGANSLLTGTFSMKGLTEIETTQIKLQQGFVQSNYNDLAQLIPAIRNIQTPNLASLGTILYRGDFNGTAFDFVTKGVFSTALGGISTDINLKIPQTGEPTYKGKLETVAFNLGKFTNNTDLGTTDFKGSIEGSSFDIDKLKTSISGDIRSIQYRDYTYKSIVTNGTFQKKYFSGDIIINDPNLNFTSSLEINFNQKVPAFNIVGDLAYSNLKALKLYPKFMEVTGLLDANFTGSNLDNFIGNAKFLNANINDSTTKLTFDSLALQASQAGNEKLITLKSNDFNASINGQFNVADLPKSIQTFLHHYYPKYIEAPGKLSADQNFTIKANANYIDPYISLYNKNWSGFNDLSFEGKIDTKAYQLTARANIPYAKINDYTITGATLEAKGDKNNLTLQTNLDNFGIGDSIRFPNSVISINSKNDQSLVQVKTSASSSLNDANLEAEVYTLQDGVRIQWKPSNFTLNNKKWTLEKEGELILRKNFVHANNVKFVQGTQEILIQTEEEDGGNTNQLNIKLNNLIIGDITNLVIQKPRFEGLANGNITLKNLFSGLKADARINTSQLRVDNDSIGLVNINAGYDAKTGNLPFSVISDNKDYRLNASGYYKLVDSTHQPLYTNIQLKDTRINFVEQFLTGIFSEVDGKATGQLTIQGDPTSPTLLGNVLVKNATLKVDYTQVNYQIDSLRIKFEEDGIDFGKFTAKDKFGNKANGSGKLFEKQFENMAFDFDVNTNNLLLIDTKEKDNPLFYGKAFGKANFSFKGPSTNAKITLVAESTDSSHIVLPNAVSKESANADFITYKKYGTEIVSENKTSNFNLLVDLDLTANNKAQIDVILDDVSGDIIKANGSGRLKIRSGSTEPLTIRGRYNIDKGNYDFSFQSLIKKPFELIANKGNYIEWTGDPNKANIKIDAQYTAEQVALYDLVGNLNMSGAVKGYRGPVYVVAQLRDKLTKPAISFKLDFPQGSPIKTDNELVQYLARLEKDDNEILKQVSFLIVFNSFAPPTVGNGGNGNANSMFATIGVNTLSQILTKEINKMFSNMLYKLTGDKSLRFDVGTSLYSNSELLGAASGINSNVANTGINRSRVNFKVGKSFFEDKIVVTFGGDLDFNLSNSSSVKNGNLQWLPDLNIEFILTQDRKLRAILFNKNSLDISGSSFGKRNRFGASISYRRDFEKLF
ncbi:MAG: translocation/assembly module TamB domain-containing protein [Sediminibacterium sp.]